MNFDKYVVLGNYLYNLEIEHKHNPKKFLRAPSQVNMFPSPPPWTPTSLLLLL